ncbi:MAG: hypothetical protein MUF04_11245 [Akkermansiaceae bacterium]|jgi:hypothetical protein|nr:hypothetical protein [Akkermansiaceae bacterium]
MTLLGALLALAALLVWLNGPGLRWLGPLAARHFLAKAGIDASLTIEGSLSHGFAITNANLSGAEGALETLTLRRAAPHYRWRDIIRGNLDGLTIDGLHADIRLDPRPGRPKPEADGDKQPFSLPVHPRLHHGPREPQQPARLRSRRLP